MVDVGNASDPFRAAPGRGCDVQRRGTLWFQGLDRPSTSDKLGDADPEQDSGGRWSAWGAPPTLSAPALAKDATFVT